MYIMKIKDSKTQKDSTLLFLLEEKEKRCVVLLPLPFLWHWYARLYL